MPVTQEQLADFHRYASQRLANGGAESLQALLNDWMQARAFEQSVADIHQSRQQYEAGEALPVDEAIAEVRDKLGW